MMGFDGRNAPMADAMFLLACSDGDADRMQLLVEAGCDTKAKSNDGTNALMYAALSGAAAAVRTALDAGWCELEAKNDGGFTAFLLACNKGDAGCMQLLVEAG